MQRDQVFQIRFSDEDKGNLAYLSILSGVSRAAVLRTLVPSQPMSEALAEYDRVFGRDGSSALRFLVEAPLRWIYNLMEHDANWCIRGQLYVTTSNLTGPAEQQAVLDLFVRWCKAQRKEGGYRFERLEDPLKRRRFMVVHENDSEAEIESLREDYTGI